VLFLSIPPWGDVVNEGRVPFLDFSELHAECGEQLAEATARVIASNSFILGREVEQFESDWAGYCGVGYAIGVGDGLDDSHQLLSLPMGPHLNRAQVDQVIAASKELFGGAHELRLNIYGVDNG